MSSLGRNDLCHCGKLKPDGKPMKYKKCCEEKDKRQAMLRMRVANRTRADFVSEPYKKCPKCGKETFGVSLHTGGERYGRECTTCWHTENYALPEIKKKIIYLDQFFISNMAKVLDPDSLSHARASKEPFWLEAYKKLDTLSKKNLTVYPDSSFHTDESLLSGDPPYEALKHLYEHLSHGCTFYDNDTITRFQVHQHFENYLNGEPEKPLVLETENVIHGKPHEWTARMRVGVNFRPYEGQLEGIHKQRKNHYEGLKPVFERWQNEKQRDFMDWFREEAFAFGEGTVKAHIAFLKKRAALPEKYAEEYLAGKEPDVSLDDLFPPPSSELIADMTRELWGRNVSGDEALKRMIEYLRSKYILNIPANHISALLFAGLARKAAHGQKAYPNMGTVTDIHAISSLLPYCDAIFVDNPMAALLNEQPIKKEIERYGTKVFSLNTRQDFLRYLDEIEAGATPEHMAVVEDAYGSTEPYITLLTHRKESKEDEALFEKESTSTNTE